MLPCGGLIVFLLQCLNNFFKNLITLQAFDAMIIKARIMLLNLQRRYRCLLELWQMPQEQTLGLEKNILVWTTNTFTAFQSIADLSPQQEFQIFVDLFFGFAAAVAW